MSDFSFYAFVGIVVLFILGLSWLVQQADKQDQAQTRDKDTTH